MCLCLCVCIYICMPVYIIHTYKSCSFIELALSIEATARKKMFFIIPKISSCGNCREHYVAIKYPAKHHIARSFNF